MDVGEEKSDFYAVLGLKKECSSTELRNAYKKLALRWHPDRCSASGNSKFVEAAKKKFQAIQEAYSVLSDANKRFLYDVGYDSDDDENGMGDFLGEMATMMSHQTKPGGDGEDSFEELQELFEEMFHRDVSGFGPSFQSANVRYPTSNFSPSTSNSSSGNNKKQNCCDRSSGKGNGDGLPSDFSSIFEAGRGFSLGADGGEDSQQGRSGGKRRNGRKQKVSSRHDMSSRDAKISV